MRDYEIVHYTELVFRSEMKAKCLDANSNDIQDVMSFPKQYMLQEF
jgi:hypothetical protein